MDLVIRRIALAALACGLVCGCMSTDGDVLSTLTGDGGAGDDDAAETADGSTEPDALVWDADNCSYPCPAPDAGDVSVCGRIIDLETNQPITSGGPELLVFDLNELREDPLHALPNATPTIEEGCAWFHTTIDAVTGWTVAHTGDLLGTGPYRRVTSVIPTLSPGQTVHANAYVLRAETDEAWSDDAGLPLLTTFASGGAVMAIFVDIDEPAVWPFQGKPLSGVTMLTDGNPHPLDDYYFSDADPTTRSTIDPGLTTTGVDGAALMRGPEGISTYSGQLVGCAFSDTPGLPIPSAVQVQEIAGTCN